jgi:Uma2 family endonuclease
MKTGRNDDDSVIEREQLVDFDAVYEAWLDDVSDCIKEPDTIYLTKSDFDNPSKRFSYADFMRIPESNRIMEILNGILSLFAAPASDHAYITTTLSYLLLSYIKKNKRKCRVYHNPFSVRFSLDGSKDDDKIINVVQPDVCVICDLSRLDKNGYFGPPELIVEVLSPTHRKRDLVEKFNLYEAAGVKEYWIIDPKKKTVKVLLWQPDGRYDQGTVYHSDQKVPVHIFKDLEIDLNELFEE